MSYFARIYNESNDLSAFPRMSVLANNGWIWGGDPLTDFAGPSSHACLLREVIVWGDCVKLRYGKQPEDNPWLWKHMQLYTEKVSQIFDGIRIDNCHSTPVHVASYFLDHARKINPNIFLMAELFTGSEQADEVFVRELGLHVLIREAMQSIDPFDLSRFVYRFGGLPLGSLALVGLDRPVRRLIPSLPRALFYDQTHDNPSPTDKRTSEDILSTAAIVGFTCAALGSTRGYDECFPKHLDVVHERRKYELLQDPLCAGIGLARSKLNDLHRKMGLEGFSEKYVEHDHGVRISDFQINS